MRSVRATLLLTGALVTGCTEYDLKNQSGTPVPGLVLAGDIEATPDVVVGIGCGVLDHDVTLVNVGDGDLTIDELGLSGPAWSMVPPALPVVLEPDEQLVVALQVAMTGASESGTLTVGSDDPDDPVLSIDLMSEPDVPPQAAIETPTDEELLSVGHDVDVVGWVTDDLTPLDELEVEWWSSRDGLLGPAFPSADGRSAFTWLHGDRSPGEHLIAMTVTDSCGNSSDDSLAICQQEGYISNSHDFGNWHHEGSAYWDTTNGWLQLTGLGAYEVGTAFETAHVVDGGDVVISFRFYIGEGSGADGISLTALDVDRFTTFLGGTGCGIGYGGNASCTDGPALPGWSIEVDTYYNGGQDPVAEDHLMFSFDGNVGAPETWASLPEMEDNGWHLMEVSVVKPRVQIAIDGITYIDQDLSGHFDFPAYVGFTAGTGGNTNYHRIEALQVESFACDP